MFSVKLATDLFDDDKSCNESILNSLINEKISVQEENSIIELKKQIFCTIQVKTVVWDGSKVLIVLIEDATDQTQLQLMQTHDREKKQ